MRGTAVRGGDCRAEACIGVTGARTMRGRSAMARRGIDATRVAACASMATRAATMTAGATDFRPMTTAAAGFATVAPATTGTSASTAAASTAATATAATSTTTVAVGQRDGRVQRPVIKQCQRGRSQCSPCQNRNQHSV